MNAIIAELEAKVQELSSEGFSLIRDLDDLGWKDNRDDWIPEKGVNLLQSLQDTEIEQAKVKVYTSFRQDYHRWYAESLAIVEVNMRARLKEFVSIHESTVGFIHKEYITQDEQYELVNKLNLLTALVASVPRYVQGRLYDIELAVAQAYVVDQLAEAGDLVRAGHIRAAGAVAGVLLERHLKLLCDRHEPPIEYTKKAGINALNEALKKAGVYGGAQWRKIQWMGDIRNNCDHAGTEEPRKDDVVDMIQEVNKFTAIYVI